MENYMQFFLGFILSVCCFCVQAKPDVVINQNSANPQIILFSGENERLNLQHVYFLSSTGDNIHFQTQKKKNMYIFSLDSKAYSMLYVYRNVDNKSDYLVKEVRGKVISKEPYSKDAMSKLFSKSKIQAIRTVVPNRINPVYAREVPNHYEKIVPAKEKRLMSEAEQIEGFSKAMEALMKKHNK